MQRGPQNPIRRDFCKSPKLCAHPALGFRLGGFRVHGLGGFRVCRFEGRAHRVWGLGNLGGFRTHDDWAFAVSGKRPELWDSECSGGLQGLQKWVLAVGFVASGYLIPGISFHGSLEWSAHTHTPLNPDHGPWSMGP